MPDVLHDPAFGMLLFNLLAVWPLARILRRAGLPAWWAVFVFVPLVGLVIVAALLALNRWPNRRPRPPAVAPKARRTL